MRSFGGATALAVLSLISATAAQNDCPYNPKWEACTGDASLQCATIKIPRNWWYTGSGEINWPLIRKPRMVNGAVDENAKSIILNPGGPGISGINSIFAGTSDEINLTGGLYHLVSFDPRGVALNEPYNCDTTNANLPAFPGYYYTDDSDTTAPAGDRFSQFLIDSANYYNALATYCDQQNGQGENALGKRIGTPYNARDVRELSRNINSDKKIYYWGFSYGTVLGDTIAQLYPQEIGKMVLDGNINPNDYYFQSPQEEASDVDAAFERYFELCAATSITSGQCSWLAPSGQDRNKDNLFQKFSDWIGLDPSKPNRGRANNDRVTYIGSYRVRNELKQVLFGASQFSKFSQMLQYWYDCPRALADYEGTASDEYTIPSTYVNGVPATCPPARTPKRATFNPADAKKAEEKQKRSLYGITCSDNQYRSKVLAGATADEYRTLYQDYLGPTGSKYAGDAALVNTVACYPWITNSDEPAGSGFAGSLQRFTTVSTNAPILFLQGLYDPVTPSKSGLTASGLFSNSKIFLSNGAGHCTNRNPSANLDAALRLYWTQGTLPDDKITRFTDARNAFEPGASQSTQFGNDNTEQGTGNTEPVGSSVRRDLDLSFSLGHSSPVSHRRRQAGKALVVQQACSTYSTTSSSSTSSQSQTSTMTATSTASDATTTGTGTSSSSMSTTTVTGSSSSGTTTASGTDSSSTSTATSTSSVSSTSGSSSSSTSGIATGSTTTASGSSTSSQSSTTGTMTGSQSTSVTMTGSQSTTSGSMTGTQSSSSANTSGTQSATSGTMTGTKSTGSASGSGVSTTGKATSSTTGGYYGSTWATWNGMTSVKPTSVSVSTWSGWDPVKPKTTTPAVWSAWSSQAGSVPATKTICGKDGKDCKVTVVAIATTTVYVDYVQDVCSTGLYTKTITVTATCNTGCDSKPTGVPQGYTTTAVYCSACATASTVIVTVKDDSYTGAKTTQDAWQALSSVAASGKPAGNTNQASWSGVPAATGTSWSSWNASPTAPNVAKYTGGATKNMAAGGVLAAFAGILLL